MKTARNNRGCVNFICGPDVLMRVKCTIRIKSLKYKPFPSIIEFLIVHGIVNKIRENARMKQIFTKTIYNHIKG